MASILKPCASTSARACSNLPAPRATPASTLTKICSAWSSSCRWRATWGVNISGMAIILQMRERMEEMQRQIQEFVQYIQQEVLTRANAAADPAKGAIVPVRRTMVAPALSPGRKR